VLIVNADDWGRTAAETDAALLCFSQGRITSVSAMVFMADSERAAGIALRHGIPVGLHLNFTEPPTAPGPDGQFLNEHRRLVTFLTRSRYSAVAVNPLLRRSFCSVFKSQLDEFIRLYKKPPTHFDGHQHFHLCSSMVLAAPIPRGQKVRRTFSFTVNEKGVVNWLYRRALDRWIVRRYRTTDYFFALSQRLTEARFSAVAQLARQANVELMTHPIVSKERDLLLSPEFEAKVAGIARKSYADL
jgi:chitin disaccharide deacetylase